MDDPLLPRLDEFLKPLYQDLDGSSRADEVERVAAIAKALDPDASAGTAFALLVRFRVLGNWLEKVGNASRAVLATGIPEADFHRAAASIRNLDQPTRPEERAVAAAHLIDGAGVRGLAERFSRARREGQSIVDVARAALADRAVPAWMNDAARAMLADRRLARDAFCRILLEESNNGPAEDRRP